MMTGGHNLGRVGIVTHRERHPGSFEIIHIKDSQGHTFATRYKQSLLNNCQLWLLSVMNHMNFFVLKLASLFFDVGTFEALLMLSSHLCGQIVPREMPIHGRWPAVFVGLALPRMWTVLLL